MKEDKYQSKYNMHFEPGSNPIILNDAKIDKIEVNDLGSLHSKIKEKVNELKDEAAKKQDNNSSDKDLTRILRELAPKVSNSRRYKWGLVCQALKRKELIARDMSNNSFAKIVEEATGIDAETVRRQGEFFVYDKSQRLIIDEIVAMIENIIS